MLFEIFLTTFAKRLCHKFEKNVLGAQLCQIPRLKKNFELFEIKGHKDERFSNHRDSNFDELL